jgi:protein phosphatase
MRLRPADSVTSLVQLANDRGGPDNISIIVARVRDTEHDETDTARGLPILTESMMDTARTEVVPIQAADAHTAAPADNSSQAASEMQTAPGMPVQNQTHAQAHPQTPTAAPTAYPASSGQDQQPQQALARPAAQRQLAQRGGRSGGLTLIVALLLLLVLGVAIGLGLAYLANVPLWPGSASQ